MVLPKGNEISIFNIGDGFRLLTYIRYIPTPAESIVYIKEFLTHAEYDAGGWKDRLDHE